MQFRSRFRCGALIALIATPALTLANTYYVGHPDDQDCTHTFAGAVAAANANPGRDTIQIGFDQLNVAVNITDDLDIRGGYAGCGSPDLTGSRSSLIGTGTDRVMFIDHNADVALYNVIVTGGGHDTFAIGGGIWKNGNGLLELHDSELYGNRALNGGGLYLSGQGAMALLYKGSSVHDNQGFKGAGVFVDEATLRLDYADTAIYNNDTTLGDPNGDRFGGGIYATGTAAHPAEVSSRSLTYDLGDPHPPLSGTRIYGNIARDGAGLYANGNTSVTLVETTLYQNIANRYGGAIFLWGANLQMLRRYSVTGLTAQCDGPFGCSQIYLNSAAWDGAALSMWNGASAHIAQTLIRSNGARDGAIDSYIQSFATGLTNRLTLEASAIVGNTCTTTTGACYTIASNTQNNRGIVTLRHVTMADNAAPNTTSGVRAEINVHPSTLAEADVQILSSIIEPGTGMVPFIANDPSVFRTDCVMAPGLIANGYTSRPLPRAKPYAFVSRAGYDYRPAEGDIAIDACDGASIPPDIMLTLAPDFGVYGSIDDATVINRLGLGSTHDLGAFEVSPLLRDGFE